MLYSFARRTVIESEYCYMNITIEAVLSRIHIKRLRLRKQVKDNRLHISRIYQLINWWGNAGGQFKDKEAQSHTCRHLGTSTICTGSQAL